MLGRAELLAQAWGQADYGASRTVDVHIAQLRAKLGAALSHRDRARRRLPRGPVNRRPGIRTVLTLATVGVAVLALALAAVLTGPLVRSSAEREARASLARNADLVARLPLAERLSEATSAGALPTAVSRRGIAVGVVTPTGEARGVAVALTEAELQRALAGERVSAEGSLAGERILLEARPLEKGGAVVLGAAARTVDDSVAAQRRRLLLALGLGLLAAVAAGAVVARRLGAPAAQAGRDGAPADRGRASGGRASGVGPRPPRGGRGRGRPAPPRRRTGHQRAAAAPVPPVGVP